MNLKQKFVSGLGIVAISLGMTAGVAMAADWDTGKDDAVLNVTCDEITTVDVNIDGSFEVNNDNSESYDASLPGGFEIALNLTCNWTPYFAVGATIGTFQYDGTAPNGFADSFSGGHLYLDNGDFTYNGPNIDNGLLGVSAGPPDVSTEVFENFQVDVPMMTDGGLILNRQASPGLTVATWDGHLEQLPPNLAEGEYVAPMTVVLGAT